MLLSGAAASVSRWAAGNRRIGASVLKWQHDGLNRIREKRMSKAENQ